MRLSLATPADAAAVAAFLTECTGKKHDEMKIHEDIADKTQFLVSDDTGITAVFNLKPLGEKGKLLHRLYVKEALRGKKIGSSVIRACKMRADRSGTALYAECPARDENLLHFLRKNGLRQISCYNDKETVVAVCGYLPK